MEKLLSICPKLNTFNKVYIARHGVGLVQNIELIGSKEDIEDFIIDEIELFQKENIIINTKPITDIKDKNSPQLYLLKTDTENGLERVAGNLYFFSDKCKDENKNVFDITGYHTNPNQIIVDTINLKGLTIEIVENAKRKVENISDEKFINDTILCHYESFDDDEFHAEDLSWIENITDRKNDTKKENSTQQNFTKSEEERKPLEDKKESVKIPAKKSTTEEEKPNNDISPKPVVQKKEEIEYDNSKEILTPEEEAHNEALVNDLIKKYNDMIEFITKMHASQWIVLSNKIKKAVQTKNFNEQWCPLYLELSDDITSELYAKLYQLDQDTQEFHKNVIHQTLVLGCFACGKNWKEDITFLPKGPHFVECPHCYAERGFEKL